MISAATRLSEHPNSTAVGFWPSTRRSRSAIPWLGCRGLPLTKRSLPSRSAFQALTGFEFGMGVILPEPLPGSTVSLDVSVLLDWYDREQRDLPWRRPGVSAW